MTNQQLLSLDSAERVADKITEICQKIIEYRFKYDAEYTNFDRAEDSKVIVDWLNSECLDKYGIKRGMINEIENPCYHCYAGASDQCGMTLCRYKGESWSGDLEAETVRIEEREDI